MDNQQIIDKYNEQKILLNNLGKNIQEALIHFLNEANISYLTVNFRVKEEKSFLEKITRKNYTKPFDECEDLCGVRILCHYHSDILKISEIINTEFDVLNEEHKEELLDYDQFGYRSDHFNITVKDTWRAAPNYRDSKNLKVEIQVRTLLMHSWAELQHKLSYKKANDLPRKFQREFSLLSAKLEDADRQFERLRDDIINYRSIIVDQAGTDINVFRNMPLLLDNLQALLDFVMPKRYIDLTDTDRLLNELLNANLSLAEIINHYEVYKKYITEFEKVITVGKWTQTGVIRCMLDIFSDSYVRSNNREQVPSYQYSIPNREKLGLPPFVFEEQ